MSKQKVGRPHSGKKLLTLRLEPEIIDHFRAAGPGWLKRVNDTLKRSMKERTAARAGRLFTPRLGGVCDTQTLRSDDNMRAKMWLSIEDARKIKYGHAWTAIVTDELTDKTWRVKGATCSSPLRCYCDAVIVCEVTKK